MTSGGHITDLIGAIITAAGTPCPENFDYLSAMGFNVFPNAIVVEFGRNDKSKQNDANQKDYVKN
ncbi:MAG TPA: hypothetical protein VFB76_04320 [Candidatus Angelobacter sp.]|nr:hypothetical protein [Candidatus Angelobacter sp.]